MDQYLNLNETSLENLIALWTSEKFSRLQHTSTEVCFREEDVITQAFPKCKAKLLLRTYWKKHPIGSMKDPVAYWIEITTIFDIITWIVRNRCVQIIGRISPCRFTSTMTRESRHFRILIILTTYGLSSSFWTIHRLWVIFLTLWLCHSTHDYNVSPLNAKLFCLLHSIFNRIQNAHLVTF